MDKFLKSKKGLTEWVGISKEHKNSVTGHLVDEVEPTFNFDEPTEPTGDNVTRAQIKTHKMKSEQEVVDEEEVVMN